MAMVPHERSLVKKLENKPFVLLGVNADRTFEDFKRVEANKQINWRSWFDGRRGPIAARYRIGVYPTLMLIDHKGVIRLSGTGDPRDQDGLERAINVLLGELAEEGGKAAASAAAPSGGPT
jgi:hypothetical protein